MFYLKNTTTQLKLDRKILLLTKRKCKIIIFDSLHFTLKFFSKPIRTAIMKIFEMDSNQNCSINF